MNDVFQVADNIAALYLGQMAAQVDADSVTHGQVVELITSGRSGDLGLRRPDEALAEDEAATTGQATQEVTP
jgi:D-xylose transport system ATP-binding protein